MIVRSAKQALHSEPTNINVSEKIKRWIFMPSIRENLHTWNIGYNWKNSGDEWSEVWGGPDMQWHGAILPRIHLFLPAKSILEIAPGFGRWTQFLKDHCESLSVLGLSETCIEACKARFHSCSHISYHVNDGKSLDMIQNESIDFVFSLIRWFTSRKMSSHRI